MKVTRAPRRVVPHPPAYQGMLGFLAFTFVASWGTAWVLRDVWRSDDLSPLARFVVCPIIYAVAMGWQPLAAALVVRTHFEPTEPMDAGLRRAAARWIALGILLPLFAISAAMWLSQIVQTKEAFGHLELSFSPTPWALIAMLGTSAAVLALTYLQSLGEEVGWRGYFLVRTMELVGPWPGLIGHGLAWAFWYVPVIWIVQNGSEHSLANAVAVSVTCVLLGILLGWLRLQSRSIVPAVVANAIYTIGAGLPFQLVGTDVGSRGAVYQPIGWVPLGILTLLIVLTSFRRAIAIPTPRLPRGW
jgi:membrane protease YdiL (CAAX protease family)